LAWAVAVTLTTRRLGFVQALVGTIAVTPDAVLLRLAQEHGDGALWVTTCLKLLFIGVFCMAHPLSAGGKAVSAGMRAGPTHVLLAALGQGLINMGYALAFLTTTVAEALMLISLHPLWGALLGRVILGEKIPPRTINALALSIVAVLIIFVPPAFLDAESSGLRGTLHGNVIAVITGFTLAVTIIINRHAGLYRPEAGMEMAAGIGSLACGLVALPIACLISTDDGGAATNGTAADDRAACADFGVLAPPFWPLIMADGLCIAICTVLTTVLAPRHLYPAEVGLILLGEQILSPFWVFLGVGEAPSSWTIGGGALLIVTLAAHELAALVDERRGEADAATSATEIKAVTSATEIKSAVTSA